MSVTVGTMPATVVNAHESQSDALPCTLEPLAAIRPYPGNPRKIPQAAIDAVAASIRRFGWRQPIVVDADGVIIAGHVRYAAAKQLDLAEAPVHRADLSADEARAYRLADNRTGEITLWDAAPLYGELKALADVDVPGFSADEVRAFLDLDQALDGERKAADVPDGTLVPADETILSFTVPRREAKALRAAIEALINDWPPAASG